MYLLSWTVDPVATASETLLPEPKAFGLSAPPRSLYTPSTSFSTSSSRSARKSRPWRHTVSRAQ